jgi:hypothetical protein
MYQIFFIYLLSTDQQRDTHMAMHELNSSRVLAKGLENLKRRSGVSGMLTAAPEMLVLSCLVLQASRAHDVSPQIPHKGFPVAAEPTNLSTRGRIRLALGLMQ